MNESTQTHQLLTANTRVDAKKILLTTQQQGQSLLPCGNSSRKHRFLPAAKPDIWLSLSKLQELLWLDVADQTCAVEAGMPIAKLQSILRPHGLQLAVLDPLQDLGTVGGFFLSREPSLLARSCGPPRDHVLGGTWLLADGNVVRSGARVVKSVAGYDLTRLFLASRGRLAICLDLTLKLSPIPSALYWYQSQQTSSSPTTNHRPQPYLHFPRGPHSVMAYSGFPMQDAALEELEESQGQAFLQDYLQECRRGQHDLPLPADSPWLQQIALACAPKATPLGCRP